MLNARYSGTQYSTKRRTPGNNVQFAGVLTPSPSSHTWRARLPDTVENVSAIFSIVLMVLSPCGGMTRDANADTQLVGKIGWTYCAIGALAITGLNPTFVPKIVFTAYADTLTTVLVGMSGRDVDDSERPGRRRERALANWHGVSVSSRWLLWARNKRTSFCAV